MIPMTASPTVPTYPQSLVGFRYWSVTDEGYLAGVSQQHAWRPGVTVSSCGQGHLYPVGNCGCGLYAYHTQADMQSMRLRQRYRGAAIMGVVLGRGQCEIHENGWRAEEATIVAIAPVTAKYQQQAQKIAERYGVPCVSSDQLQTVADQYGQPFRESLPKPVKQTAGVVPIWQRRWKTARPALTATAITAPLITILIGLGVTVFSSYNIAEDARNIPNGPVQRHLLTSRATTLNPSRATVAPLSQWQRQADNKWMIFCCLTASSLLNSTSSRVSWTLTKRITTLTRRNLRA